MVVRVSEIPDEGLSIEGVAEFPHPYGDSAWVLESLSLVVAKDEAEVLVRGRLGSRVPQTCSRCVEPFVVALAIPVDARFCPRPLKRDEEQELTPDDLDVDFYADDLLDLNRLIQTETELGLPMKPLCRKDCQGLCPVCGGNRNAVRCACEARPPDPRLASLRGLAERLSARASPESPSARSSTR